MWLITSIQIFQLILETTDDKYSLPFLDMSINVQPEGTIFLHMVSKTFRYWKYPELS